MRTESLTLTARWQQLPLACKQRLMLCHFVVTRQQQQTTGACKPALLTQNHQKVSALVCFCEEECELCSPGCCWCVPGFTRG